MNFIREFLKELEDPMPLPMHLAWLGRPLIQSFVLSLILHCVVIVSWEIAFQVGIVASRPSRVLKEMVLQTENKGIIEQFSQEQEVPLMFIEVAPQSEEVEPAPNAKYYSSASTRASNPDPVLVSKEDPRIHGVEQEMIRTMEKTRMQPEEMNPIQEDSGARVHQEVEPEPSRKPLFAAKPSDLGVGNAEEKPRPRTLKEAQKNISLIGTPTEQKGGVHRHSLVSQMDVMGTPFGNYDAAFIAAVQKRWYDLIDASALVTASGKVVVVFKLYEDGRIDSVQEVSSTVNTLQGLLCQKAITDPAPYSPWPSELRRAVQGDVREVKFTFYYR
ncbi:MAG: TonB C-terminal domain-containing protein [Verrucomicrobia bacterium]|nr:TonB C-terminal domain-containing protein [Verrucomicrobiota bacterium]